MRNFLSVEQFSNEEVLGLVNKALEYKENKREYKAPVSAVNMFFENSTRTKHSFEVAEHRMGMHIINFDVTTSYIPESFSYSEN